MEENVLTLNQREKEGEGGGGEREREGETEGEGREERTERRPRCNLFSSLGLNMTPSA